MTPKEKAEDIWVKYYEIVDDIYSNEAAKKNAKMYALIAVDEILNEYPSQAPKNSYEMERHIYFQEVKQEIEKL